MAMGLLSTRGNRGRGSLRSSSSASVSAEGDALRLSDGQSLFRAAADQAQFVLGGPSQDRQ
jgi:hypothetical protein